MIEKRFERKWVIKNIFVSELISALKVSKFEFIKQHENRWVNSVYYDDMFNSSIYQNLNGDQKKQKIRFRWYGDNKIINPRLEVKKKNMFLTTKTFKKILFNEEKLDDNSLKKLL